MKTTTLKLWFAAAAICALTACTHDEPATPSDNPHKTITVQANTAPPAPETRLVYTPDGQDPNHGLTVRWKDTDETFYVIYDIGDGPEKAPFYQIGIDSDNPKNATFTGALDGGLGEDAILYAVYPDPTEYPGGAAKFDLSRQSGTLDGLISCMYSSKVYKPSEDLNFSFRYLSTALKLTLEFPDDEVNFVDLVILKGLSADLLVELKSENRENPRVMSSSGGYITISGEPFAVVDNKVTVYLSFCPGDLSGTEIQVWAIDANRNQYIGTLEGANLDAGYLYHATVGMIKDDNKFENEATVDGSTPEYAYVINSPAQLKLLADRINRPLKQLYVNKYYKLTTDIDISSYNPWTPINNSSDIIAISLDGGGHTISGLYINATNDNQGLFGYLNGTGTTHTISNVILENPQVSGESAGALAGDITNMAGLSYCHVTGDEAQIMGNTNVGGLVGYLAGTPAIACSSSVKVEGSGSVGGLIGSVRTISTGYYANVIGCFATGAVTRTGTGPNSNTGGLIGHFSGPGNVAAGCYTTGNVTGEKRTGGLIGLLDNEATLISCYTTSTATGSESGTTGCIIGEAAEGAKAYYCGSTEKLMTETNENGIGNTSGNDVTIQSCVTGQTSLDILYNNYLTQSAAQEAWGNYSIKSEKLTGQPITYSNTIVSGNGGRFLNGTNLDKRIWVYNDLKLKLWWE